MLLRLATLDDLPVLCGLLDLLFAQEAEFQPDDAAQRRGLSRILENRAVGEILVVEDSGQAVAMVSLLYSVSTALGEPVAWLEDMVVAPSRRAGGTGSRLLEAAIAHARQRGCRRLTLLTDHDNQGAQRFYARQGFAHSPMVPMRLML